MNVLKRIRRWVAVATAVLALAGCAQTGGVMGAAASPKAQRFADLYLQALPVGKAMQIVMEQEPRWPLHEKMFNPSAEQVACMRAQLNQQTVEARLRKRALGYAARNPDQLDDAIRLLGEGGMASYIGGAVMKGMESGLDQIQGRKTRMPVAPTPSVAQATAMIALFYESENEPLRQVLYMDSLGIGQDANRSNMRERGQNMGMRLFGPMLLEAMVQCKIDFEQIQ